VTEPVDEALTNYDYSNEKTTSSFFVRESFRPAPGLLASVELQATHHRFAMRDDRIRGFSFDGSYSSFTPRAGLNWNVDDRFNLYGSFSTARSEPAFRDIWDPQNPFAPPTSVFGAYDPDLDRFSDPLARPERLRDYELGVGYRNGANRFKANVYRMDFRDELVFAGGIDSDGLPITDNAGRSTHQGIELEAAGRLPGEIDVTGYIAWSRDVLEEYTLVFGPNPTDVVDYSGNRIALFPDHQARLRVSRKFGSVRAVVGARRIGTIYLDNSENERLDPAAREVPGYVDKKIDPQTIFDLQAYWDLRRLLPGPDGSLSLDLHVENLLDRRYAAFGYAFGQPEFIPAATRSVFVGITYGF
jgi:iron complex outermembrane receptor protein